MAYPKGTELSPLTSFDNPHSPLSRDGEETTFQKVAKHYNVNDGCIEALSDISNVIEMIPWQKPLYPDVVEFEMKLQPFVPATSGVADLDQAFTLIDQYCDELDRQ